MTFQADTGDEPQYHEKCAECKCRLTINTPIMCYTAPSGKDKTLCTECYEDCKYWKDDTNEDNEEEIYEYWRPFEETMIEAWIYACVWKQGQKEKKLGQASSSYVNEGGRYKGCNEFDTYQEYCAYMAERLERDFVAMCEGEMGFKYPSFRYGHHDDIGIIHDNIFQYGKRKFKIMEKPTKKKCVLKAKCCKCNASFKVDRKLSYITEEGDICKKCAMDKLMDITDLEFVECERCGYEDKSWCESNGCDKGRRRIEYFKEEGILK